MSSSDLARRCLHLKLYPPPETFSQRREVLRMVSELVSKHGEVSMFRSLKYHPISPVGNAFLAIFSTTSAAQLLLDASPVRYQVALNSDSDSDSEAKASRTLKFVLDASSTSFSHEQFVTSRFTNPLHCCFFPKPQYMSVIGSALSQYFPQDKISSAGMLDWDTDRGRGVLRIRNPRLSMTPRSMSSNMLKKEDSSEPASPIKPEHDPTSQ